MKLRHQASLFVGGAGMATLIAILLSVREQLVAVGPWVLDSLLACAGSALLYGGFRVYVAGRRHFLALQAQEVEIATQKQQIRLADERHVWEMRAIQADIHVRTSYLLPDQNGNYPMIVPTIVDMLPAHLAGQIMAFAPGQTKGVRVLPEQAQSRQNDDEEKREELPDNVRYEDIRHLVPSGHVLVGIGAQGVETKPQAVGACVWIVGLSGTGKTSTTVLRVEERKQDGHVFLGADPHFFKDDSLFHAIYETTDGHAGPYADRFLLPMAKTPEEILAVLNAFHEEFKARKAGVRAKPWRKITLLVDEVGSLMDKATATTPEEKAIIELLPSIARICGQEARNFQMGGIFISQQATGIAWLRKVALMVIVHQLIQENEKRLATNNDPKVMEEMKYWPIGRTYILGVGFQEGPHTVQQPYFQPVVVDALDDEEMERLQPNPLQSATLFASVDSDFEEDSDFQGNNFSGQPRTKKTVDGKVLVFPQNDVNAPVERPDRKTETDQKPAREYRFTETEAMQFIAAYKVAGNIEKVLSSMKKGSGYKPHARELIQSFSLKQA